jgi:hypothetical protein
VQKALAPFIVTLWNGREPEDAPDEVQQILQQRPRQQQSNILVFVLDSQGKYVHSFDAMTDIHPAPMHELKKRMPTYFTEELKKASKQAGASIATPRSIVHLPTVDKPGVRIYVTLGANRMNHFQVPVVEAVAWNDAEKEALKYRDEKQTIDAEVLRRWLAQMYPPAVMDGHGGMDKVTGTVHYTPAGESATHRYAVLKGKVTFHLDNATRISYQGPFDLVLRYSKTSVELEACWGTMTTSIPRHNPQGKVAEMVPMTVALEPVGKE